MYPKFFLNFLNISQGQSFIFCLKMFKFSAFFNSAGKSFQRIPSTALTVSKPALHALMFRQFSATPDPRL